MISQQNAFGLGRRKIKNISQRLGLYPFLLKVKRVLANGKRVARSPSLIFNKLNEIKYRSSFRRAVNLFYKKGKFSAAYTVLEDLQKSGAIFDKKNLELLGLVQGYIRLANGMAIPPRQPNPGLMTRRQHILYCLHQSVPHATNGYSTRSHGVAVGLQQAGWKVCATTRPGFPWDTGMEGLNKGYHKEEVEGVSYTAVSGWNLARTPLDYYLAEAADHYFREAQVSGAELVVAASNHITALPALVAARRLGLPFVYEVRGLWEVTQASTQPEWAGSERYQLMRKLEKQAALEADLVITLTEELADELASWGVARERIEVVPNAVNAERFLPMAPDATIAKELNLKPGVPVIGYAGSAVAYEGLELLMEAMAQLKQKGQGFTFVLVGDGKIINTVKAKAKELDIEAQCRFTGRVPFEEVPRYLSCMDILPIPRLSSAVTEMVSALKPLEAMAMEKALVLSDVSPHKTMAGPNDERARLFTKNSVEALCEALQQLIDSPEERKRLGKAARAWIEQERTWNHVTRRYAEALQRLRRNAAVTAETQFAEAKKLEQITLGLIADQFTTDTLASAVKVVPLSPQNWREELEKQPIDVIFIESAWRGNNGQWHRKVGYYCDEELNTLSELLNHCREQGIPSLFWNKEDPVHFERFRKAASLCDHVFTTDSRKIIPYLSTPSAVTQTASSCPFFASPKIHNLLPSTRDWQPTAAYGGTYYGERYPERTEYMDKIMSAAAPLGLTIYDRQHNDPESPYKYPGGLSDYVAGSLSYEEMIQAYKAHPVQINVNSVLDSPTMFSRRVMEAAACGSPIVSGPALGMNHYLEGAGNIVRTESEAAQALENLLQYPAHRWRVALKGARAIIRAHTTQHRLAQMLRTAGMVIMAPEPPMLSVLAPEITMAAMQRLLAQTLRPQRVVASQWQADTQVRLEAASIQCSTLDDYVTTENSLCLLAEPLALEDLEPEDLEDLAWPTQYAPHTRIGFIRDTELADGQWPGVALETSSIDTGLQLVCSPAGMALKAFSDWASQQPTLALRKPGPNHEQAPNIAPEKTVLIAGHDLKFIKPFYPYFTKAGVRVLLDFWKGHNKHNEITSKRLVYQADTIFCEWMLGNAIWYGKHKREGQKLVGRLHLQEIDHALFPKIPFEAFDTVMFVGPHILRQGIAKNPVLKKNGIVVYNGVDVEGLQSVPRKPTNGKVLGFVGIVPQRKRFDLALDILQELRKVDDGYILRIKGKRPEEYPWMANRPNEMSWYEAQYKRIKEDSLLEGAVYFDPHGNDMPEWYSGIDYVLSTSDFESFHFTIADGIASGGSPIIMNWEGSGEIYKKEWVVESVHEACSLINKGQKCCREELALFSQRFSMDVISGKIFEQL
ncbi:glycosyltransferase [Halomonas sp. MCCC 1A11036]|uniref:Glycosyltransferase n=1 Tax=Billgrantia zhangzhouensis TaxID=2733481 RepID=A0ABS9ACQ8_9GAMM|nr:glycosyltransferase [Halomonas zhangzhouensis]MCE8018919.1 glycosyltransferase [Halomonas zhangzhouensis]